MVNKDLWFIVDNQEKQYPLNLKLSDKLDNKNVHFDVVFNAIHGAPGEDGQLAKKLDNCIYLTQAAVKIAALTCQKRLSRKS